MSVTSTKSAVKGDSIGSESPKPAEPAEYEPEDAPLFIVNGSPLGPFHKYIVIDGLAPSGGVPKLALFIPSPSCPSAFTESPLPHGEVEFP